MDTLIHILAAVACARAADSYLGACVLYLGWLKNASSAAGVVPLGSSPAASG